MPGMEWSWSAGSMIYVMRQQAGQQGDWRGPSRGAFFVTSSWLVGLPKGNVLSLPVVRLFWCKITVYGTSTILCYAVLVAGPTRFMGLSFAPAWPSDGILSTHPLPPPTPGPGPCESGHVVLQAIRDHLRGDVAANKCESNSHGILLSPM